ncbi:MAG: cytochrome-c peroxidase [Blastocatellales bacterium]
MARKSWLAAHGNVAKHIVSIIFLTVVVVSLSAWRDSNGTQSYEPQRIRLGERLFRDQRFTTSKGDLATSCATCHLFDEDPQGRRAFTDFFNRSWVPFRTSDPRRTEIRNSPILFDVGLMPQLHFDGEFKSLEELVAATFSGRPMGWLPGEEEQAFNQLHSVLLQDKGSEAEVSYAEQFKAAYDVDLDKLTRDQVIGYVSKAVADFVRTFRSKQNSPYDQFIIANGFDSKPGKDESAKAYGERMLVRLSGLEAKKELKLTEGFSREAVEGYKIFLRSEGRERTGNCVGCHAPPLFTDFSFHNMGISQIDYDQINGEGKFAAMDIPGAAKAVRPSAKFRELPERGRYGVVDLGHWNFIDLKTSPLRRAGESDDQLLRRMIGAFKSPTLRHLAYSEPYFHSGNVASLENALSEIIRLSEMARAGRIREADEELLNIRLKEADVAPLLAFLNALNEELKP